MNNNLFSIFRFEVSLIIIIALVFTPFGIVTAETVAINPGASFKNGYISNIDGHKIKFSTMVLGENSITYKTKSSREEQALNLDQVFKVKIQKGSEAMLWGTLFAASGLIGSLVGLSNTNTQGVEVISSSTKSTIVLSITAVFGLIGMAIGSTKKKYETVFTNPVYEPRTELNILSVKESNSPIGLMLSYHF